ncbi:hypothetical protein [Taklimakanibacter lacteus]|uniref:hypothetical protein n=1 Tax=Taklimakanibacter lacteus TaxID=2268456 RepID=UPI0013C473FC
MTDAELAEALRSQARSCEETDRVNPFLTHEYEVLLRAADRIDYLSTKLRLTGQS